MACIWGLTKREDYGSIAGLAGRYYCKYGFEIFITRIKSYCRYRGIPEVIMCKDMQ